MLKNIPTFHWNEDLGVATCIVSDGHKTYIGTAKCHSDDLDMMSEKTGCEIALRRAKIKALKDYRNELKIGLRALNQLYYSMAHSTHFNEKSYENKMLQRQIRQINFDLTTTKEIIATEEQSLKTYLTEKDKFYNKIRSMRHKDKSN